MADPKKELRVKIVADADLGAAKEADETIQKLTAEEERLLKVKSQFLTAAEAEVAEVERLAAAARREASAKADATAATAAANAALNQTASEAVKAAKSLDQLEEELRDLQRQFSALPVGGKEFTVMAGRVKEAEAAFSKAEAEARRLGGTVGRRGNAGMAVLEFSRMFEDAQYGIRGVLNNIPGLIAMLGGSAGLAGAISIAAVAGAQLWERMGSGAKAAKDPLEDYKKSLQETKEVFDEIEQASQKQRDEMSRNTARDVQRALGEMDLRNWFSQQNDSLERLKIQSEGRLAIARQQLEVVRLDAEISQKTGTDALRLAERRRDVLQKIRDIEAQVTEELRQQDIIVGKRAVRDAEERAEKASDDLAQRTEGRKPLADDIHRLEGERREVLERRLDAEKALADLAEKSKKQAEESTNSVGGMFAPAGPDLAGAVAEMKEKAKIEAALKALGQIDAEIEAKTPGLEKASADIEAATDRLNKALEARLKAVEALDSIARKQEVERNEEEGLNDIDRGQKEIEQRERVREAEKSAADGIAQMLADITSRLGDAANSPNVQANVGRLEEILKDGFQVGEQNEVSAILLRLSGELKAGYDETYKVVQGIQSIVSSAVGKVQLLHQNNQDIKGRLDRLESQFSY